MTGPIPMRRDLSEPFTEPHWPGGVALVLYSEAMAEELHALLVAGYARGESTVPDFDPWWTGLTADPDYDAELIFVAEAANGALVGLAQCWNSGIVRDVVVARGWRRQGIGEALMLRAFSALANRYHTHCDLVVPAGNLAALRLFKRLGFVPRTGA